ncbi:hypothetical protein ACVV4I_14070 [Escherichia coli]
MVGQSINIFPGASLSQSDRLRDDLLSVPVGFRQCMPANIDILAFLLISGFVVFAIDTPLKPTRSMSSAYAWAKSSQPFSQTHPARRYGKYETYRNS